MMQIALVRAHYHLPTEEQVRPLPFQKLYLCKGFLSTVQASLHCEFILCTVGTRKTLHLVRIQPHQLFQFEALTRRFSWPLNLLLFLSRPPKFYSCMSLTFRQCDGVASRARAWLPRAVLVQLQRSYQHSQLAPSSALQHWLGAHTHWQSLLWAGWIHTGKTQLMAGAKPLLWVCSHDGMFFLCVGRASV